MKAAIIGAGFISDFHADAYRQIKGVSLVAICDIDPARAQAAANAHACDAYTDAETMLRTVQPQLVSVCVPTHLHETYVRMALSFGAHVLCEKPLALTMDACQRMANAANQAGRVLMAGQVLRWWPEYCRIAAEIERLGPPSFLTAQRLQHAGRTTWLTDPDKGGGALFDLFVHDLDYICALMGDMPAIEAAWGERGTEGSWRSLNVMLRWPCGTGALVQSSNMMPPKFPFTAALRADYPAACVQYQFNAPVNIQADAPTQTVFRRFEAGGVHPLPIADGAQTRAFRAEIRAFVEGARQGISPLPVDDTLAVMRLIHEIKRTLERSTVS